MHNKMYNKISSALQQVLPNNWEDVVLYSHIKDDCYEYKFYVRVNGEYILCFKLEQKFNISQKEIMNCFDELYKTMLPDYQEKQWYSATIQLSNQGDFSIDYDYEDHSDEEDSYKDNWKKKYLK